MNSTVRIRWINDLKDQFLHSFREQLINIRTELIQNVPENIDNGTEMITCLYTSAAASLPKRFQAREHNEQQPLWDREFQELKQRKYSLLRKFRLSNLDDDTEFEADILNEGISLSEILASIKQLKHSARAQGQTVFVQSFT